MINNKPEHFPTTEIPETFPEQNMTDNLVWKTANLSRIVAKHKIF